MSKKIEWKCDVCNTEYDNRMLLMMHEYRKSHKLRKAGLSSRKHYYCEDCGYNTIDPSNLKRHLDCGLHRRGNLPENRALSRLTVLESKLATEEARPIEEIDEWILDRLKKEISIVKKFV